VLWVVLSYPEPLALNLIAISYYLFRTSYKRIFKSIYYPPDEVDDIYSSSVYPAGSGPSSINT
jgi:hypothetical protein